MTVSAFLWVQMDEKMELFICWLSRLMPWIADTAEDSTATSTGTSAANTECADGTTAATGTPTPSLRAQAAPTPAAISATSQTGYAHSATATQNGVTFTVS